MLNSFVLPTLFDTIRPCNTGAKSANLAKMRGAITIRRPDKNQGQQYSLYPCSVKESLSVVNSIG